MLPRRECFLRIERALHRFCHKPSEGLARSVVLSHHSRAKVLRLLVNSVSSWMPSNWKKVDHRLTHQQFFLAGLHLPQKKPFACKGLSSSFSSSSYPSAASSFPPPPPLLSSSSALVLLLLLLIASTSVEMTSPQPQALWL